MLFCGIGMSSLAKEGDVLACNKDVMFIFDASGSMSGTDWTNKVPRIDRVRGALAVVLPDVTPARNVGLIVYGPGPYNKCDNIELRLRPGPNSAEIIMEEVRPISPAGRTPLTASVQEAANALSAKEKPGVIVLLTDGEETCGGKPCALASVLKAKSKDLTVHVIGYSLGTDGAGIEGRLDMRCLAEKTGGLYIAVETTDELIAALRKTLACPFLAKSYDTHWPNA
ncbi:MAG: VWA domain-containing protein [Hyphomicrobiaceae bacterium]